MTPEVQALLDMVQQFGIWIIFAWLYITEKRDHMQTRKDKDIEIEKIRAAYLADIREMAGMRTSLYSVQGPAVPRTPEKETIPAG